MFSERSGVLVEHAENVCDVVSPLPYRDSVKWEVYVESVVVPKGFSLNSEVEEVCVLCDF